MAIPDAGGSIINTTFAPASQSDFADQIRTNLVAAGWTSTGVAGNWVCTSAQSPSSLKARVRIFDPATGTCTRLTFQNTAGTKVAAQPVSILPSGTWRIIANKYQFFCMDDSGPTGARRDLACGGVLAMPSFLAPTEAMWGSGKSIADTNIGVVNSFRDVLTIEGTDANTPFSFFLYGASQSDYGTFNSGPGTPTLVVPYHGCATLGGAGQRGTGGQFIDNTYLVNTAYMAWNTGSDAAQGTIQGMLWNACVVGESMAYGDTRTFDSKTWFAITHNNNGAGPAGGNKHVKGTLLVRTA